MLFDRDFLSECSKYSTGHPRLGQMILWWFQTYKSLIVSISGRAFITFRCKNSLRKTEFHNRKPPADKEFLWICFLLEECSIETDSMDFRRSWMKALMCRSRHIRVFCRWNNIYLRNYVYSQLLGSCNNKFVTFISSRN